MVALVKICKLLDENSQIYNIFDLKSLY